MMIPPLKIKTSIKTMSIPPTVYMGVSENGVPLNPMVNDHYPH